MNMFGVFIVLCVVAAIAFLRYRKQTIERRETYINNFEFPETIRLKLAEKYPHLNEQDIDKVIKGLREYFLICHSAGRKMVSMPSQATDVAWHEFILFTKQYEQFCQTALGRFLHHTPAEAMTKPTQAQQGIKTAWRLACARENIKSKSPSRLPLLFALDAELAIPDGFNYALDCKKTTGNDYCASHIGCGSGCGGGDTSDSSCSSGCGGD